MNLSAPLSRAELALACSLTLQVVPSFGTCYSAPGASEIAQLGGSQGARAARDGPADKSVI